VKWTTAPLSEIATIERNSVSPTDIRSGSRYVGLDHIETGGGSIRFGSVTNGELASSKFQFGPNHILFGKLRPYLAKVVCPDFEGICSTDIIPIAPSKHVDKRYLLHFLRRPETIAWAAGRTTGVNLPRLSPRELASLEIQFPSLDDQRRLGAILDRADILRHKRKQALTLLKKLTDTLIAELLDAPLNIELGEVIAEGPTNGLYKPSKDYGKGVPILRINSFYDGKIVDLLSLRRLSVTDAELSRFKLTNDDIVINRVNSLEYLGKSAIVRGLSEPTVYESNMMRFSLKKSIMLPDVCIALLQTPDTKQQILAKAKNAVNQSSINQRDVCGLRLALPAIEIQQRFVARMERIAALGAAVCVGEISLNTLFSSLQSRAFSGQL
jgi:type I restriction enzyme S subunit